MDNYNIVGLVTEAAKNVTAGYYKVETANGEQKYRERVFCYELYHQMRERQKNYFYGLIINGELDKTGNINYKREKPDFVIHVQGTDDRNEAIIEVKNTLQEEDVYKDIGKIDRFIRNHKYKMGIFLTYNQPLSEVEKVIKEIRVLRCIENKENIYIIAADNSKNIEVKQLSEIVNV